MTRVRYDYQEYDQATNYKLLVSSQCPGETMKPIRVGGYYYYLEYYYCTRRHKARQCKAF